jgi:hypothetical protein
MGQVANFYKNYIKDKDTKVYRLEPYHTEDYILNKKHLIKIWCDLLGIEWNGSGPRLYFSPLELEYIKIKMMNGVTKPIFLLHTNGGGQGGRPYSWYRDLPTPNVLDVVEYFKNDYHIYQLGYENQQLMNGCHRLTLDTREILAAINFSQKRLLIDSFTQHASAAFGLKSIVCWVGNSPTVLGYNTNINLKPDVEPMFDTLHSSYLDDFDIGGNPIQYPYDSLKLFDSNELIKEIKDL